METKTDQVCIWAVVVKRGTDIARWQAELPLIN